MGDRGTTPWTTDDIFAVLKTHYRKSSPQSGQLRGIICDIPLNAGDPQRGHLMESVPITTVAARARNATKNKWETRKVAPPRTAADDTPIR